MIAAPIHRPTDHMQQVMGKTKRSRHADAQEKKRGLKGELWHPRNTTLCILLSPRLPQGPAGVPFFHPHPIATSHWCLSQSLDGKVQAPASNLQVSEESEVDVATKPLHTISTGQTSVKMLSLHSLFSIVQIFLIKKLI
ncbi:uncharacterized [Tachysurus ichikawai]